MSAALQQSGRVELSWGMPFDLWLGEASPMVRAHWQEVGSHRDVLSLQPQHELYRRAERAGALHILTARVDHDLAGYLFLLTMPHPRDRGAVLARDDIFYVSPRYRRLRLGVAMIEEAIGYAGGVADILMLTEKLRRRARGVQAQDIGMGYLARWGFTPTEMIWSLVLKRPHDGDPA